MRWQILMIAMAFPFFANAFDHSHSEWDQVIKKYQDSQGLVKYKQLKSDVASSVAHPLNSYLKGIQEIPLAEYQKWTSAQQKSFLINSYNALTVKLILDNYPVKSIKKIGGLFKKPWSIEFFSLLGDKIKALDPIEHQWLRPKYKDFRIHAAVNCASISCPPLRSEAYVPEKLDQQLDSQMRLWLADSGRNQVGKGAVKLSKIFDWYKDDFENWGGGTLAVVRKYAPESAAKITDQSKVDFLDYNWDLNESH